MGFNTINSEMLKVRVCISFLLRKGGSRSTKMKRRKLTTTQYILED